VLVVEAGCWHLSLHYQHLLGATSVSGSSPTVGKMKRKPRGFLPSVRVDGEVMAAVICSRRQEARGEER
jgi:hypothetical protein